MYVYGPTRKKELHMPSGREHILVFQILSASAGKRPSLPESWWHSVVLQESVRNLGCLPEPCDGAYF
jgi:hypothetical protein